MTDPEIPEISDSRNTKTLTGQCYCKSVHFTITIPKSALPLKSYLCHCSICRYVHGAFSAFHALLPDGVAPQWIAPSGLDELTRYHHPSAMSDRHFCSTCGCHIGDLWDDGVTWVISTSIFEANRDDQSPVWCHFKHVNPEPGLLEWFSRDVEAQSHHDERKTRAASAHPEPSCHREASKESELLVQCHCSGVSFTISRPTLEMRANPEYKPWISPSDPSKWLATMDVCDDCRLQTGAHAIPWTFVPKMCLSPAFPDDLRVGTSKTYASSESTLRFFCGICGATVGGFFGADGTRQLSNGDKILNISCGLLNAPEGILAEEWLTWRTGRLAHYQSGLRYDKAFAEELAAGMASWGRRKHGVVHDFEID
ncbi:glutathione-dependent formaldehyde-activating enzyme [Ilyonectria destructans]|nr:glutathione-dependent formaldehyde-activating enzyme [Ilyonectria destructans]